MTELKLVVAIMNFLKEECCREDMSDDTKESLEVAIQCLQTAYDLKTEDIEVYNAQIPRSLKEVFSEAYPPSAVSKPSPESLAEAEKFKTLGNDLMKAEKNSEAVDAYTQAISLNSSNAVYYCNRAAAYSRLADYLAAVRDCEQAIALDPKYSKAYGRMGLAYSSLGDNAKAIQCYKKAVELDPSNESYQSNLKLAEEKASKEGSIPQPGANAFVDMTEVLSNPVLRNLASRIMQDPNMVNMMSGLMTASINESGNGGGMDSLFHAGQRLAQQMQASNPQLIEQLREQFLSSTRSPQNSDNKDPASN